MPDGRVGVAARWVGVLRLASGSARAQIAHCRRVAAEMACPERIQKAITRRRLERNEAAARAVLFGCGMERDGTEAGPSGGIPRHETEGEPTMIGHRDREERIRDIVGAILGVDPGNVTPEAHFWE